MFLVIAEKESQIKRRNDSLMKKETDLETFAKVLTGKENLMYDYEKSLNDRAKNLEYKEKQYGVQVGQTGILTGEFSKNGRSKSLSRMIFSHAFFFEMP